MQYVISFLEGIITFVSPCLLPMLPVYLSYFALDAQQKNGSGTLQQRLVAAGALDQAVVTTVRAGVTVSRL